MEKTHNSFNSGRAIFSLIVFICCIMAGAVLKIASSVVLPIIIGILLAVIMYPLVKGLDKIHCPRYLSIFLVVIIICAGLYTFGIVLFTSGKMILAQYPKYENRFTEIYTWTANLLELPNDSELSFLQNLWGQQVIRNLVRDFTLSSSNFFIKFASSAVLVVIYVVFILLEASYFKEKLELIFEKRSVRINKMGHYIMAQVTRYLTAKFFISLANGVIFALAFHFIGLEFAIVWGAVQFLMNFIPNLGSIVTGAAVSLFALIQFWPNPGPVILVIVVVLAVNLILGSFLDPKIIGDRVGLSPLMIILSLIIWGFLWGFAGMVLSVPMTVIIKIVCENIPVMEPISILIGSKKSVRAEKAEQEKAKT
ncbi:MAG: AI-2E family transporter [Treponema sp.]|jgi:predicted PurR-regulated permease PerM|nr:AI-2E family transporter [Treponema sp.]